MLKNSAIYLTGSLLNKAIPFLMLPVLTRYLSPAEYGTVALFLVSVSLTAAVMGMNVKVNIGRDYYHVDEAEFRDNLTAIFAFALASFLVVQTAFALFLAFDLNPFGIPPGWMAAVPVIAFMTILTGINLTLERVREKAWRYFGLEFSNAAATALLTLYLIVVLAMGWEGQAIAFSLLAIVYGIFSFVAVVTGTGISRRVNLAKVKEVLRVSIPLFPHALAATVIVQSDRLFIDHLVGTEATGIYSVGYQFGAVAMLFSQAYMKAWSPWFYKTMKEPTTEVKTRVVKLTYLSLAGIAAAVILYSAVAKIIFPLLVDARFHDGAQYILWVAMGCIAYALYQWAFPYLILAKKTDFLALSSSIAMVTNLGLNYVLITRFGPIGAAYATFLAYLVSAVLVIYAANRFVAMPWRRGTRGE